MKTVIRLSEIADAVNASSFLYTINAGVIVTIIDDRTLTDMQITLQAHQNATVTYHLEPSSIAVRKTTIDMELLGQGAQILCSAIALLTDDQQQEIITKQHHRAPHTRSKVTVRLAHTDASRSIYHGAILVEKEAPDSSAFQDHKALLLAEGAYAYARPTLEAKTDQVQCGHGSAIGFLDPEQLWYLQSRGLDSAAVKKLLINAFLLQ